MKHTRYDVKITRADGDSETFEVKASSPGEAEYHATSKAKDTGFLGPFDVSPIISATKKGKAVTRYEG